MNTISQLKAEEISIPVYRKLDSDVVMMQSAEDSM